MTADQNLLQSLPNDEVEVDEECAEVGACRLFFLSSSYCNSFTGTLTYNISQNEHFMSSKCIILFNRNLNFVKTSADIENICGSVSAGGCIKIHSPHTSAGKLNLRVSVTFSGR